MNNAATMIGRIRFLMVAFEVKDYSTTKNFQILKQIKAILDEPWREC